MVPEWARVRRVSARPLRAEHRYLTVMFCDMVELCLGQIWYRLESEAYSVLLENYLTSVRTVVRKHGGVIAPIVGDGVFGGVWMAAKHGAGRPGGGRLRAQVVSVMRRMLTEPPVMVRIAVETGWVLMNAIDIDGSSPVASEHWRAVGPAPHIAARLQNLARPNAVIVGAGTLGLLGGRFAISSRIPTASNCRCRSRRPMYWGKLAQETLWQGCSQGVPRQAATLVRKAGWTRWGTRADAGAMEVGSRWGGAGYFAVRRGGYWEIAAAGPHPSRNRIR